MEYIDKLRLLAFQEIYEDDSFCCPIVKKQIFNYMKEADEHDIKAYLLDGDLDIVNEDAKPIIDQRFEKSIMKEDVEVLDELVTGILATGAALISSLIGLGAIISTKAVKVIKRNITKCARRCKEYQKDQENRKYKLCIEKCKLEGNQETLKTLKQQDCSKDKDPEKCKEKTKKAIEKLEQKIKEREKKIKELKNIEKGD